MLKTLNIEKMCYSEEHIISKNPEPIQNFEIMFWKCVESIPFVGKYVPIDTGTETGGYWRWIISIQKVLHSIKAFSKMLYYFDQTVFWNISYYDKPYFEGVFGDFVFPDGTKPNWETLSWLQKHFMKWFNKEREKYVLTFPVNKSAAL